MFHWEKRGLVFNPSECKERPFWRWNFAQGENALLFDNFIRVYFCCREKPTERGETVSRVSYVDLDKDNPMRILKICDRPVLDLGECGTFDEFGTYPFSVIRKDEKIYGYSGCGFFEFHGVLCSGEKCSGVLRGSEVRTVLSQ